MEGVIVKNGSRCDNGLCRSSSETVDGSSLSLEGVDYIHGGDGLSPGVLSVGDGVSDDALEEALKDLSGVIIDEGRDSLDTSSPGEPADGGLGDALNRSSGVPLLGGPLGADLALASDSLASFALSSHSLIYRNKLCLSPSNLNSAISHFTNT